MGRGRAKAKQTKVARELKYTTTGTDLDRLRAELASDSPLRAAGSSESTTSSTDVDDDEEIEDDEESWPA